jgi:hypothetical protein
MCAEGPWFARGDGLKLYCYTAPGLRGVKLVLTGLWSSGNGFSGVMNHGSPSDSPTDESGFGGSQEKALPAQMHSASCKVWWSNNGLGLFFMVQSRPLSSSDGTF